MVSSQSDYLWYLTQQNYKLRESINEILPDKLPKKNFAKSYRRIPFSFEVLLVLFFMLQM